MSNVRGARRLATTMARRAKRLARTTAELEQQEDAQARQIVQSEAAARILEMLEAPPHPKTGRRTPLPALLIINSKSGPQHDSLLRVRDLVDLLAAHGIAADVRVKLHKSQARRDARAAARAGMPLVIAAGGDGTVAAVARGLVGSRTVLGIIPLGTYNNVATSLGVPADVAEACALVASAPVRAIDMGEVRAQGMKRPRAFLEMGAVGIAAPLAVAGQGFEKGRWDEVTKHLPHALDMAPAVLGIRIDGQGSVHRAQSLLAVVANTPRAGAALVLAPEATLDDGLLDVRVYEDMTQPTLATHFVAIKTGMASIDPRVRHWNGRKVVIRSTIPLPVVADAKVVGATPARFRVLSGSLLVIAGRGDGLARPAAQSLLSAIKEHSEAPWSQETAGASASVAVPASTTPSVGRQLLKPAPPLGFALAAGTAIALLPTLSRWLDRRRHPRAPRNWRHS